MAGTLYLVATPIGNLEDMTYRAVRVLSEADLIAAEDTRNSIRLLTHFGIRTPMTSYHEFNKYDKGRELVDQLLAGKNIALITDAGTPGISDPGQEVVRMCHEAGVTVTSVPGACAAVTALIISGQETRRFVFEAFLPAEKKERCEVLSRLKDEERTMVIYEAPHHLKKTLAELFEALGDRSVTIERELTKKHEIAIMARARLVDGNAVSEVHGHVAVVADDVARLDVADRHRNAHVREIIGTIGMPVRLALIDEAEVRQDLTDEAGAVRAARQARAAPDVRQNADEGRRVVRHLPSERACALGCALTDGF